MNRLSSTDIAALNAFIDKYPTWWWRIGVCGISRDFTAAPQCYSPEVVYVKIGNVWDSGFSRDSTGSVANAIYDVMNDIDEQRRIDDLNEVADRA